MKLIIFDCDGTIVDSQHKICEAMHDAYAAHGLPMPARERLLSIVGLSLTEAFTVLGEGVEGFPVQNMVERYRAASAAMRASQAAWEPLFPGARAAVEALAARPGITLGIATGKSRRGVEAVLGAYGLRDRFATIQSADYAPSKPHPGMVLQAMEEAGAVPDDTVVVGDSIYDMAMANAAGAAAVGVSWGYQTPQALLDAGAAVVLDEFAALVPALDRLWAAPLRLRRAAKAGHA